MIKHFLKSLLLSLLVVPGAQAAEGGLAWDKFPADKISDNASLQHGAKLFVNYCLNCHAASYLRFNRLTEIGLTEEQIKANLLIGTDKIGETMKVALDDKHAKEWFGATPPDLSVIARSRSAAGGRWNSLERPIVSSASSIALACLECVLWGSAGGCPQEAMTPIAHGSTSPGKGLAQRVPVGLIVSNRSELGFTRRTSMNSVNQGR